MIDRRLIQNFDWYLILFTLTLIIIGVLNIYSATYQTDEGLRTPIYMKQIYWAAIGLLFLIVVVVFDYHLLLSLAYPLYGVSVALLLGVLLFGRSISGSQRWITIASVSFQPSELIKIALILALAKYFSQNEKQAPYGLKDLTLPLALVLIPALLIMKQPDLGTALLLLLAAFSIILFLGVKWKILLISLGGLLGAFPFLWHFLKEYQKKRILIFIQPEADPLGAGYHILQSKIAVGSGAFLGKGFMKGTQGQLRFLPEQHTDFAFSVLAEEWGFVGAFFVLTLYLFLLLWSLDTARQAKDRFGLILALGVTAILFWQGVINIGMVVGVVPVVGVPLPFISYGGSSILASLIGVGLLLNIHMRRFIIQS